MPIKIMYLLDGFETSRGGTEGQVLQLIQHIDRSRYMPCLTLLRKSEYIERNDFACQVIVLGISRLASISTVVKLLRFGFFLRRENYRIVHSFFNDVSMIAPPFLRMFGVRMVVSRRDMGFWFTPAILAVLRFVSPYVDRYVVNSKAVQCVVREREHVAENKITVIYNGYLRRAKTKLGVAVVPRMTELVDKAPIIGIVANLRRVKRIDTLIRAFGAISTQFQDVCVVIVGDVQHEQAREVFKELKTLATQFGVDHRVIFTGAVEDSTPYINLFSAAVLCSESEGFSNSLIEYMQAGRPIVCTNTGGNPELVQDGVNGLLFPVDDAVALADCLIKLLSDSGLARRLGEAARETVRSAYSHTRMIAEQMACYDEVLSDGRSV